MERRRFIRNVGSLGAGVYFSGCKASEQQHTTAEKKMKHWAWSRWDADAWTEEGWRKKVAEARNAGIDAILVQCCNNKESLFPHPNPLIKMKRDLVAKAAKICHQEGVEFHAWMWTMPADNPRIIAQHPDWYAVNRLLQPAHSHPAYVPYYKFLDPSNPEVQEFVTANVRILASIAGVDGIHLDYVRMPDAILAEGLQPKYGLVQDHEFPEYDYNYSRWARSQFKAQTGLDPLKDIDDPEHHQAWRQFRYDSITHLVNKKLVPAARAGGKQITAAVFPNWQSVRQQWQNWDLDGFLAMLYNGFYNRGIDFIEEETRKGIARLKKKIPVYSGIYRPDVPNEKLAAAYAAMERGGGSGIAIFSLEDMDAEGFKVLKAQVVGS